MDIKLSLCVEKIENGYVVRDACTGRATYVPYYFGIARVVESMVHDRAVELQDRLAIAEDASRAPMQQDEDAHPSSGLLLDPPDDCAQSMRAFDVVA